MQKVPYSVCTLTSIMIHPPHLPKVNTGPLGIWMWGAPLFGCCGPFIQTLVYLTCCRGHASFQINDCSVYLIISCEFIMANNA